MRVIAGFANDSNELKTVTSGGIATAISKKILLKSGIVYGVTYSSDFKSAHYIAVQNLDELKLIKGTKYIRPKNEMKDGVNVSIDIEKNLINGRIILFIGLPCEVFKLKSRLKKNNIDVSLLYTIDLICHGPALNEVHEEFISILEQRFKSKIIDYNMRYKKDRWKPAYIKALFESGDIYLKKLNDTEFGKAFNIIPQSCSFTCIFKNENYYSDMTIGDYWGLNENDFGYNDMGVSVGFVHDEKINDLLELEYFTLFDTNEKIALEGNPRYSSPLEKSTDYDRFYKQYKKKGLLYASKHGLSMKSKIMNLIYSFVKILRFFLYVLKKGIGKE